MNTGLEGEMRPVIHLELHTGDLGAARDAFAALCGWQQTHVLTAHGAYHALELGRGLGGGIVESAARRPLWLPYVEVEDVDAATAAARGAGAQVLVEPREGSRGWRSIVATRAGGELGFWQPKR